MVHLRPHLHHYLKHPCDDYQHVASFTMINPNHVIRHESIFVKVKFHNFNSKNYRPFLCSTWTYNFPFIKRRVLLTSFAYKLLNPIYKRLFQTSSTTIAPIVHPITIQMKMIHVLNIQNISIY